MGFGKDGKGVIIREARSQALAGLSNSAGILVGVKLVTLERFRMLKLEVYASITALTSGEGTGLLLGLADGDYIIAEIEAAIEANGPLGPNETVEAELAMRPIWFIGAIDRETGTDAIFENEQGGYRLVFNPRWTFSRTKSWNFFVYNMGNNLTTGATVIIRPKSFGVWVT